MMNSLRIVPIMALLLSSAACKAQESQASDEKVVKTVEIDDGFFAQESAWREVDPENLMLIDTDYGRIGVELYPEIAPIHAARIKRSRNHV